MRFLLYPKLQKITGVLSSFDLGDRIVKGRVEAYSCKRAGEDRAMAKEIQESLDNELKQGIVSSVTSPLGPLGSSATRRLLIDLIATLNAAFPDYDFTDLRPENFGHDPDVGPAMKAIDRLLLNAMDKNISGFKAEFWKAIDEVVELKNCEVYSYLPEPDEDAMAVGKLWNFNYFFYNKRVRKIVFFTCFAVSKLHAKFDADGEVVDDPDQEDVYTRPRGESDMDEEADSEDTDRGLTAADSDEEVFLLKQEEDEEDEEEEEDEEGEVTVKKEPAALQSSSLTPYLGAWSLGPSASMPSQLSLPPSSFPTVSSSSSLSRSVRSRASSAAEGASGNNNRPSVFALVSMSNLGTRDEEDSPASSPSSSSS